MTTARRTNMTKRMLIGAFVVALALIGAGCDSSSTKLEVPTVAATVTNDGATLHLTWDQIAGAKSYEIKAGDSTYTTTSTSLDVTHPAATVEVRAVSGNSKGDSAVVSCNVIESTVEFYGDLDYVNPHSSGFGFAASGSADTFNFTYPGPLSMDFYGDGKSVAGEMRLVSSGALNPNRKGNGVSVASGSYDDAKLAVATAGYSSPLTVMVDSTYYLRISSDTIPNGTWSTGDNYAKAKVVSITSDSLKVTLKLGYQKIEGLRWLGN
jgi:hypothetical protein